MELTCENMVVLEVENLAKDEIIELLAKKMEENGVIENLQKFKELVFEREAIAPTTVGYDIGLPHGKGDTVKKPCVAFARLKTPVLWNLETNEFVKMVFLLAIPEEDKERIHTDILVKISKKILDDDFRDKIEKGSDSKFLADLINK